MLTASLFLILLIVVTPITLLIDGPIVHGLVMAVAAVSVAIVALRIRPGEIGFLSPVIRRAIIGAAFFALWMLIQVLPLKIVGLANPIWESAATALGRPLAGSISIDPGATLLSVARYFSAVAIAFVAAAIAVDRRRAESILFALSASTTIIALMVLAARLGNFSFLSVSAGSPANVAMTDCAGLGIILALATAFHIIERAKTQQLGPDGSASRLRKAFAASLIAFAICCWAVFTGGTGQTYFAVTCGVATITVAIIARRFQFGVWGFSAIVAVALVAGIAAVTLQPRSKTLDLTLAFAARAPASLIDLTQRILAETSWAGTGAGTFAAVLPIYRDVDELATGSVAPTAAAAIAVEMGYPFLWMISAAAIALIVAFLRGALRRRRDSFYPIAGASSVVTIALLAFGNAGLFNTAILVTAAAIVGIALAQSKGRSTT